MSYTRLKVTEEGIVLCDYHLRRLAVGGEELEAFVGVAKKTGPSVWSLWLQDGQWHWQQGSGSQLHDGIAVRYATSPVADQSGAQPKPRAPCVYDAVRARDSATLLTSVDGQQIYEACRAAIVGWDGTKLVCTPQDRPRVWSTTEAAIREHLPVNEAPIPVHSTMPILLINAVKGPCTVSDPKRQPFPRSTQHQITDLCAQLTHYPE